MRRERDYFFLEFCFSSEIEEHLAYLPLLLVFHSADLLFEIEYLFFELLVVVSG